MTQDTLAQIFGWMTVINFAMLAIMTAMMIAVKNWAARLHAALFDLDPQDVRQSYFTYLANYKLLIFVFCLAPYLALKLI
ncbi:MAG: hypothetical protein N4A61_14265 [Pelagimonas sp.]|nr:hypothetical protein [Pelagimonas sp.]